VRKEFHTPAVDFTATLKMKFTKKQTPSESATKIVKVKSDKGDEMPPNENYRIKVTARTPLKVQEWLSPVFRLLP
jgi:hypothetical protein